MSSRQFMMPTLEVHTASPFKDLFPIRNAEYAVIAADMKKNGFNVGHPIFLWAGHDGVVLDGHSRLKAALQVGVMEVPVIALDFDTKEKAVEFAIGEQVNRRNLSNSELIQCLDTLDKLKKVGRKEKLALNEANCKGKSAEKTAELLGITCSKVEHLRTIKDYGSDKIKADLAAGKLSVNKAYNDTMKARRAQKTATEPMPPVDESAVHTERISALTKTILKKVRICIEQECREYTDISYSQSEKNGMVDNLFSEIGKLIVSMLPGKAEEIDNNK